MNCCNTRGVLNNLKLTSKETVRFYKNVNIESNRIVLCIKWNLYKACIQDYFSRQASCFSLRPERPAGRFLHLSSAGGSLDWLKLPSPIFSVGNNILYFKIFLGELTFSHGKKRDRVVKNLVTAFKSCYEI